MNNNELRDRIAYRLWHTEEKSWEDQAQAVIDDLGLTTTASGLIMVRHGLSVKNLALDEMDDT